MSWRLDRRVRRVAWCHAGGARGFLGRRARVRLAALASHGRPGVAGRVRAALWEAWLRDPDDELWELLGCGQSWPALMAAAFAAAVDPEREARDRGAIGEFCLRHQLVPDSPVQRVLRAAVREALPTGGELDAVRVITGSGPEDRGAEVTGAERDYLVGWFAERRDWAGLWRLAQDLPITDAVAAVRLTGTRWRPESPLDRELFDLLARAHPDAIRSARAALSGVDVVRVDVPDRFASGALSDDGERLAVVTRPRDGISYAISVYSLPDGHLVQRHEPGSIVAGVLYDGSTLVSAEIPLGQGGADSVLCHYLPAGERTVVFPGRHDVEHVVFRIVPVSCGLAALSKVALYLHDHDGRRLGTYDLRPVLGNCHQKALLQMMSDPQSGRVVVRYDQREMVLDASRPPEVRLIWMGGSDRNLTDLCCFRGRDRLIGTNFYRREVSLLGTENPPLTLQVEKGEALFHPIYIPARQEICGLRHLRRPAYLDARSLTPVSEPREFSGHTGSALLSSPSGSCYALAGNTFVDVAALADTDLQSLVDRPPGLWRPADAGRLRAAIAGERHIQAQPVLDLLERCLAIRFGGDVALGTTPAGDDDIAMDSA